MPSYHQENQICSINLTSFLVRPEGRGLRYKFRLLVSIRHLACSDTNLFVCLFVFRLTTGKCLKHVWKSIFLINIALKFTITCLCHLYDLLRYFMLLRYFIFCLMLSCTLIQLWFFFLFSLSHWFFSGTESFIPDSLLLELMIMILFNVFTYVVLTVKKKHCTSFLTALV